MDQAQYQKVGELRKIAENWLATHNQYKVGDQNASLQEKAEYMQRVAKQCADLMQQYQRLQSQGGYVIRFVGTDDRESKNTARNVNEIGKIYTGKLTTELFADKDPEKLRKKYKVEVIPTVFFCNGNKVVAKHEGEITQSMLSKKADMLLSGGDFSDSKSVDTLQNQKTITNKEVVSMGEFLIIFYDAVWCGVSKMMKPIIEKEALQFGNKIKLEKFDVDYRPEIAKKYNIQQIPATIFIHKGREVGRLIGYFDDTKVHKIVEQFVDNEQAPTLTSPKHSPLVKQDKK